MDLQAQPVGPREIRLRLLTDLPEGTNLLVDAGRGFLRKGRATLYAGKVYEGTVTVRAGRIDQTLAVDDAGWYSTYQENAKRYEKLGLYPEIVSVSPEVTIKVTFSPQIKQPDEVLAVLGNNADHIGGAGAVLAGGFTTLSVSASVNIPFVE